MEIISRSKYEGRNFYTIKEGTMEYASTERGLYDSATLDKLKESGYRILGYHGNIMTPEGVCIQDIVETPCTLTDDVIDMALMMEDSALSEAEAASYFDRSLTVQEVQLKEPKVEIHTREELIKYLCSKHPDDWKPLNAITAREALFTIEELISDSKVRQLFDAITKRRKISSYGDYQKLIKFLQEESVLGPTYTADDIRTAYLSWGICGLRASIIDTSVMMGIYAPLDAENDNISKYGALARQSIEYCLLDKQGILHYPGGKFDTREYDSAEFKDAPASPLDVKVYRDLIGKSSKWDTEFKVIRCAVPVVSSRSYYTIMGESGVMYKCKVDTDAMAIRDIRSTIYSAPYLSVAGYDKQAIPLSKCIDYETYKMWEYAKAKTRSIVIAHSTPAPVKSSYEMCIKEGVNPSAAVNWCAVMAAKYDPDEIDYTNANTLYREGPDAQLIAKYNPDEVTYETLDELIDIFNETREVMEENGQYLFVAGDDHSAGSLAVRDEIMLRPLENLTFAKNLINGTASVGKFAKGKQLDGHAEIFKLAELFMTLFRLKGVARSADAVALLQRVEQADLFDVDTAFPCRDNAANGYFHDKCELNGARASQADWPVMITRVFRENANAPKESLRHYMFECVALNMCRGSVGIAMRDAVTAAIVDAVKSCDKFNYRQKECIELEAPALALALMFRRHFGGLHETGRVMGFVLVNENVYGEELTLRIPESTWQRIMDGDAFTGKKFITLYEWCDYEMRADDTFRLYALNANINPWYVTPKPGFKIGTYNFNLNYVLDDTLQLASDSFKELVAATPGARVCSIMEEYTDSTALLSLEEDELSDLYKGNEEDALVYTANESPHTYYARFMKHRNDYEGRYLVRVPLKSDVIFANYAPSCGVTVSAQPEFADLNGDRAKSVQYTRDIATVDITPVTTKNLLSVQLNDVKHADLTEVPFEEISSWPEIVEGTFKPTGACVLAHGVLLVITANGTAEIDLTTCTLERFEKLVSKGIIYQTGARQFFIRTIKNDYLVEVRCA